MKTIIHDLENLILNTNDYILNYDNINYCRGCFNCWTTSPLNCIYKDKLKSSSNKILNSDTLIIISKNTYGTYSSKVKKILERNISFVHPYFVIRNNEIHHKTRTNNKLKFIVLIYGYINYEEKILIEKLIYKNKINFNLDEPEILYFKNEDEIRRYLNEFIY